MPSTCADRLCLIILSICCSHWTTGNAQVTSLDLPELHTRVQHTFTINDGFPTDCFNDVLVDAAGRLWMSPCVEAQNSRELHLFQYDGYSVLLHELGYPPSTATILHAIRGDSSIVGIEMSGSTLWEYSIRHDSILKYHADLSNGYVFNVQTIRDKLVVLAFSGVNFQIFELGQDSLELKAEAPATMGHHELWIRAFTHETAVYDNKLYTVDRNRSIFEYDPATGKLCTLPTTLPQTSGEYHLFAWRGKLHIASEADLAIYRLDNDHLTELDLLPDGWSYLAMTQFGNRNLVSIDESDNIVVNCSDDNGDRRSLLVDTYGKRWDFTSITLSLPEPFRGRLVGKDFRRSLFDIATRVTAVEVAQDYGITPFRAHPGRSITMIDQDLVLLATDGMSWYLDQDLTRLSSYQSPRLESFLRDFTKTALLTDAQGMIWSGSPDSLKVYDPSNGRHQSWPASEPNLFTHYGNGIALIDRNHLIVCNLRSQLEKDTLYAGLSEMRLGNINAINASGKNLWIATSRGLWLFREGNTTLEKINIPNGSHILSMLVTSDGTVLLGTESSGVIYWDPKFDIPKTVGVDRGLSHNTVAGLIEDDAGNIWVNTFNGINVLSPDRRVIARFYQEDGVANNEGNRWSAYKHIDGRIIFGSIGGFTVIDPVQALKTFKEVEPPLVFVSRISHQDGQGRTRVLINPQANEELQLPAESRSISVSAGLSDYVSSRQNTFDYKFDLPGYGWTPLGNMMPVQISNMPPGKYQIHIRGRNSHGVLSVNNAVVNMDVARPFYQTIGFYALLAFPIIVSIVTWIVRSHRERRRLEEEVRLRTADIERQAEELREVDKMKSRIYTNITHEFRTPLTLIKGVTNQLPADKKSRAIVHRNVDRLLNLVNQMLDLSKLESGTMEAAFISGNIVDVARDIFASFAPLAEQKDIGLHFHARPEEIVMDFDVDILFRIVGNLLSNAIKYTQEGGHVYLDLNRDHSEKELTLLVRDTGIGIHPEKTSQIFDRFYQVDGTMTRAGEGTGVGLALTRELVEYLQGKISVESTLEKGSTFIVSLPIRQQADPASAQDHDFSNNVIASGQVLRTQLVDAIQGDVELPRILVVEDTPDLLNYITTCLKDDYNVLLAMDGQAGIDRAVEEIPDVIVSDVMMPIKDGLQLCAEVKDDERTSHIPVLLLTAKADTVSKVEGLSVGADAYIAKPFEKNELLLTIRNALQARRAIHQRYASGLQAEPDDDPAVTKEDAFIIRLNTVIDKHLEDDDFGVMPLSREMQYSRSQLHNKVKALTGYTISSYIQLRRLNKARNLLVRPDMNISEVAWAVGFKDPNYFSRLFKREFGVNPSDYSE